MKMKTFRQKLFIIFTCCISQLAFAQTNPALALIKEAQNKTLEYKDQSFFFSLILDAPGRNGNRVERKNKGSVILVGDIGRLILNEQSIYLESNKLITVSDEDEEITVRLIDTNDNNFSPVNILDKYTSGSDFKFLKKKQFGETKIVQFIELIPKNQEDILKVILGIELNSKKVHSYHEYGKNDVITKVELFDYKVNQGKDVDQVKFDRNKYPDYDYIAPNDM